MSEYFVYISGAMSKNTCVAWLKKNYYTSATVATSDQYRSQALQSARGNQHVSVKAQQVSVLQGSFSWLYIEILG